MPKEQAMMEHISEVRMGVHLIPQATRGNGGNPLIHEPIQQTPGVCPQQAPKIEEIE